MPNVIIYTTPQCVYCKMAKDFFDKNKVAYQEKDVAIDEKARDDMIQKSGQFGVPVIEIGKEIVIGFDKPKITQLLQVSPRT